MSRCGDKNTPFGPFSEQSLCRHTCGIAEKLLITETGFSSGTPQAKFAWQVGDKEIRTAKRPCYHISLHYHNSTSTIS